MNITFETSSAALKLKNSTLCGHSYGRMVITGVADRMAERIETLAYLDAFVPEYGDSCNGLLPKVSAGFGR